MKPAFLVVDKPMGITSHDVVAAVRAVTGIKKVGHTGTLDPFATGVLPLALGPATRLIQFLDESIKVYDATIKLGERTDTGDPTGEVIHTEPVPDLEEGHVREVLATFLGERMQEPPAYSAVKVDGKALYKYARAGEKKRAKPRPVTIREVELIALEPGSLRVHIHCSRGTYARVLADEIGVALGSCGHLSALCRLRSGPFFLEDAVSFPQVAEYVAAEPGHDWKAVLMGRGRREERVKWRPRPDVHGALNAHTRSVVAALSHLPLVDVGTDDARRIRSGGGPPAPPAGTGSTGRYLVVNGGEVVAVAEASSRGPQTIRVMASA
jgi:tRNA pseudouridine55 synthase